MRTLLILTALLLSGCATLPSGPTPYDATSGIVPSFDCKGKGAVTFTAGVASGTATFDCGDGAYVHQVQPGGFQVSPDGATK